MEEPFIDFAKAYFRYAQGHRPTKYPKQVLALRVTEGALLKVAGSADIAALDFAVLDQAAQLARDHYSPLVAYHAGQALVRLAQFLSEKQLIGTVVTSWKNPNRQPRSSLLRTGPKAKAIRESKMPDEAALDALAEIFASNPEHPRDIFTTSTFAMLMCAPSRITEILELPVDCEVEEVDSQGIQRYGWRFFSAKGFEGDIKWIPSVMVPIAKEAVRRVREITEEARKLAKWIEANPSRPYRHANCPEATDDTPLTIFEACAFLGLACHTRRKTTSSLFSWNLATTDGAHTLDSLWKIVMGLQPEGFPWLNKEKKIKFSNALFCMSKFQLADLKGTSPVILWAPSVSVFDRELSPINGNLERYKHHKTIFDRFGYLSEDGRRLRITSHQPRHLLNTIANRGGLSQEQIAKWSGRADITQNRVYNHMSEFEMVAKAEALDTSLTLFGPKGEVTQHIPLATHEINLMERGPVHVTEFGVCVHDYTMSPCEKFRDCINCQEQVCIKGDGERLGRLKARLAEVERDFSEAQLAIAIGYAGADRWYEHHEKTITRLRQLVEILESTQIPDGSQIKLRDGKDFSHLRRAIREKAAAALEHRSPDAALFVEMTRLLGGENG